MRFVGLDPWPEAVPLIEFAGFCFDTPDSLSLSFRYWGPDGDPSGELPWETSD